MAKKPKKKKKRPPVQPGPEFAANVESAAAMKPARRPRKDAAPAPEILPPLAIVPSSPPEVQPPSRLFSFEKMFADLKTLELLDGPQIRDVLEKQLNLLGLNTNQLAVEQMKFLADPSLSDVARAERIKQLAGIGYFADAISRQRLALAKSEFMPARLGADEKDPADMPLQEWEEKFGRRMYLPALKSAQ